MYTSITAGYSALAYDSMSFDARNRSATMSARLLSLLFLLTMTLMASYAGGAETGLSVRDGWIREAPPTVSGLAGYLVIENDSAEPRELIAAESAAFESIEMHRSTFEDGIARMSPQSSIPIPADGRVALEPGGYHLMMLAPVEQLRAGDQVRVLLTFDGGERLPAMLRIRRAAGDEMQHHHHQ